MMGLKWNTTNIAGMENTGRQWAEHISDPQQSLQEAKPKPLQELAQNSQDLTKSWLPTSLMFALASNSGPSRESQIALQTNHIRYPIVSPPPAFLNQEPLLRVSLKPSPFWLHSFSIPLPDFDSLPNAPEGGWPPGYSKALSK